MSEESSAQNTSSESAEKQIAGFDRAISKGGWIVFLVVILDQASKYLAEQFLVLHHPVAIKIGRASCRERV